MTKLQPPGSPSASGKQQDHAGDAGSQQPEYGTQAGSADLCQIGEVAEHVGLSLRTVRYYEEVGLVIPSGRTQGGFRLYTQGDIARLVLIKQMKPLGFRLEEMRDLLEIQDRLADVSVGAAERNELLERLSTCAAAAAKRCQELQAKLENAKRFARGLQQEIDRHRPLPHRESATWW